MAEWIIYSVFLTTQMKQYYQKVIPVFAQLAQPYTHWKLARLLSYAVCKIQSHKNCESTALSSSLAKNNIIIISKVAFNRQNMGPQVLIVLKQ